MSFWETSVASQLYRPAPANFRLPRFTDSDGRLTTRQAEGIPFISWPDGSWCLPANLYMQELYRRGLSTRQRGGTLATYAAGLSHLLRFCWELKRDPRELTDDDFAKFVAKLITEPCKRNPGQNVRGANRVIDIGRVSLDFLNSYARHLGDDSIVGPNGRVRCEMKTARIRVRRRNSSLGNIERSYWHHAAFPARDPLRKRLPISNASIALLRKAAVDCSSSRHQRKRRLVMIKLLEMTGGRRGEVARLTVKAVREAAQMDQPMLRMPTLKTRRNSERLVPVHAHDLRLILEYIDLNRARVVRETMGAANDRGYVLISELTGEEIDVETVTREIAILASAAGLKGKACAHMFRHRFITKVFVALIEAHRYSNADEFRRALLDGEAIKRKVVEWTGHRSIASLEPYIHLAFDEYAKVGSTYSRMATHTAIDSFAATVEQTIMELQSKSKHRERAAEIVAGFAVKLADFKRELLGLDQVSDEAELGAA